MHQLCVVQDKAVPSISARSNGSRLFAGPSMTAKMADIDGLLKQLPACGAALKPPRRNASLGLHHGGRPRKCLPSRWIPTFWLRTNGCNLAHSRGSVFGSPPSRQSGVVRTNECSGRKADLLPRRRKTAFRPSDTIGIPSATGRSRTRCKSSLVSISDRPRPTWKFQRALSDLASNQGGQSCSRPDLPTGAPT
jgi:hypothetical protein